MAKLKKHVEEELEALRKESRNKKKAQENKILGHIKTSLEDLGYPDHPHNIGICKESVEFFLGGYYLLSQDLDDYLHYLQIRDIVHMVKKSLKKKHEFTPLWKSLNEDDE